MFKILLSLFTIFNIIAIIILLLCCISVLLSNLKLSKIATAKIALPTFTDCKSTFKRCCVTSSLFLLLDWIMFSSSYISDKGEVGKEVLAKFTLIFATIWAVMILIVLILEIVIKFIKNNKIHLKDAFAPLIVSSVWYFILTFIIV